MALAEAGSSCVYACFEEARLPKTAVGDAVGIRVMSGIRLRGRVAGIARSMAGIDSPQGGNLLAWVNPDGKRQRTHA